MHAVVIERETGWFVSPVSTEAEAISTAKKVAAELPGERVSVYELVLRGVARHKLIDYVPVGATNTVVE